MDRLFKKLASAVRGNTAGTALITSLMFMVILTALGMASIMTSSTEILVARNFRLNQLALDYANAGVNAALAKMDSDAIDTSVKAYDTSGPDYFPGDPNQTWSAKSDDWHVGFINYSARISYSRENDLHWRYMTDPGNPGISTPPLVVAYSRDCGYPKAPMESLQSAFPVYVVRSTGKVMSGGKEIAKATVLTEVAKNTINVNTPSGYVPTGCTKSGGNVNLHGTYTDPGTGDVSTKPSIYTPACGCDAGTGGGIYSQGAGNTVTTDTAQEDCNPDNQMNMSQGSDNFLGMPISDLRAMADYKYEMTAMPNTWAGNIAPSGGGWNDLDDPTNYATLANPKIYYIKLCPQCEFDTGQVENFGLIIIDAEYPDDPADPGVSQNGIFKLTGNTSWKGFIYVMGDFSTGAGTVSVYGSVMVSGTTETALSGTVDFYNDPNALEKLAGAFSSKMINWQRIYDYNVAYE